MSELEKLLVKLSEEGFLVEFQRSVKTKSLTIRLLYEWGEPKKKYMITRQLSYLQILGYQGSFIAFELGKMWQEIREYIKANTAKEATNADH